MMSNSSVTKQALSLYKGNLASCLAAAFSFLLMSLMAVAPMLLTSSALIVTVPLVFIPAIFSLEMTVLSFKHKAELSSRTSFRFFGLYFSGTFFGSYRLIVSFCKVFLVYMVALMATHLVAYPIMLVTNPSILDEVNNLLQLYSQGDLDGLYYALNGSNVLLNYIGFVRLIGYGFGGMMFAHCVMIGSYNVRVKTSLPSTNGFFLGAFRDTRSEFYKKYVKANWLAPILLILGFATGVAIAYFLGVKLEWCLVAGLAGSMLFISFYLPYFFYTLDVIASSFRSVYKDLSIRKAEEAFNYMKQSSEMNEKDMEILEEQIKEAKRRMEENEDDPEDNQDSQDE